jgi:hypothetical protein
MVLGKSSFAQYHDANWIVSGSYLGQGYNVKIYFQQTIGLPNISLTNGQIPFSYSNASISDFQGNLLFITNGIEVYDKNYQVIPGCIIQNVYTVASALAGLNRIQSAIFLPWPGDTNKYVLFYAVPEINTVNSGPCSGGWGGLATHLYYTVLDKTLNGGNGGVVSANNIAVSDTLVHAFGLAATKHANGRDWWILVKERCSSKFATILLTPAGLTTVFDQYVNPTFNDPSNGAISKFSPDGSLLGVIRMDNELLFYQFDRCTGLLSDPLMLSNPFNEGYFEFSSNSRFLYRGEGNVSTQTGQYDLSLYYQPNGVLNSLRYVDPNVPDTGDCGQGVGTASAAQFPALAPNSKIYWGHPFSCNLSVINYPDSLDTLCQMEYNNVILPFGHVGSLPYHPNYRLGPITGSVCDSLTNVHELLAQDISVYPNPAKDNLFITSSRSLNETVITLFNIHSQILLQQSPGFGNNFELTIPADIDTGIYMLRVQSKEGVVTKKIVIGK